MEVRYYSCVCDSMTRLNSWNNVDSFLQASCLVVTQMIAMKIMTRRGLATAKISLPQGQYQVNCCPLLQLVLFALAYLYDMLGVGIQW